MDQQSLKRRKLTHPRVHDDENDMSVLEDSSEDSISASSALAEGILKANRSNRHGTIAPRTRRPHVNPHSSGDIYNSDLFQVQVGELLEVVQPNYENWMARVEEALRKLKRAIEGLPSRQPMQATEAEKNFKERHKIAIPFPESHLNGDAKHALVYAKPESINVVGSFVIKTAIKRATNLIVDLAVCMPSSMFQDKDYLNYRYFYKRAYYLACIAAGIQESPDCNFVVQYDYQNSNPLQPVILVSQKSSGGDDELLSSKFLIKIILAAGSATFPVAKTMPWKNCIRITRSDNNVHPHPAMPTALYNATIRAESATSAYHSLLHASGERFDSFRNGCVLSTVWLRQRGFETGVLKGGFGAFEVACMLALLLQGGGPKGRPLFLPGYSSYQLFKAFLQFLDTRDLVKQSLVIGDAIGYSDKNFNSSTPVVFDAVRGLNILWKMSTWSYKRLQHEAKLSLKLLSTPVFDRFQPTFITRIDDPVQQYDVLITIPIPDLCYSGIDGIGASGHILQYCKKVYTALVTGLGDRVKLIHPTCTGPAPWFISQSAPSVSGEDVLTVGLLVDPKHINRAVDRGPAAGDKKAAAAFQNFWGQKAELRRFKDGSITESLIWNEKEQSKSILEQIMLYIIDRHIQQDASKLMQIVANDFSPTLLRAFAQSATSLLIFQPLNDAFEALSKQIRELEGLPLQVRQISASCQELRYASFPFPSPISSHGLSRPMDINLQFEGSSRWPEDLISVQKTKVAFLLKIGELLEEALSGSIARLGLENEKSKMLNSSFLEIIYPHGAAFRLRIYHELELSLLNRQLKDKFSDPHSRTEAVSAISQYKRTFVQSPSHTQALRTLCTRFPCLSPSIRVMKQWCSSHLLSGHISDELIELLAIRTFLNPHPWIEPGSTRTAFLRTLSFIAKWDWRSEPLIVDFSGAMAKTDYDGINMRFEAWRNIDPALNRVVLFAASNLDPEGITWTERAPSKMVAARFSALAKAAYAVVKEKGIHLDMKMVFAPSLDEYDWVIRMNSKVSVDDQSGKQNRPVFKNLQTNRVEHRDLVGYNPVRAFIEELEAVYGKTIVLFYNASDLSFIAGLWNPQIGQRPWKVNLTYSTIPSVETRGEKESEEGHVFVNKAAILNDIARLGGDMIAKIDIKRSR